MSTVVVAVALAATTFQHGTPEVASIRVTLLQDGVALFRTDVAPSEPIAATFTSVADGAYTASSQAVAADGSLIGTAVTADFSVVTPTPDVSLLVPSTVTVTISA